MLHALLKTVHLLAMFVWLGGMFFTLACLRPALGVLESPLRPRLMSAVLQRFLLAVAWAAGLVLASGIAMLTIGQTPARPPSAAVSAMALLGLLMMVVFVAIRIGPYRRLREAIAFGEGVDAANALASIRRAVTFNLVVGVVIVVITQFPGALSALFDALRGLGD